MPTIPPTPAGRLLSEFMPLLPAEMRLREACRKGNFASFGDERPKEKTADNHIRPGVLRVFCLGLDPDAPTHQKGIQICGAWIDGNVDFEACKIKFPVKIVNSVIHGPVNAQNATTKSLDLSGTSCYSISGYNIKCDGDMFLRNRFSSEDEVNLVGSTIDGNLDCSGGTFKAATDDALSFDSANIGGSVSLGMFASESGNLNFAAEGTVRLVGASIARSLDCSGGLFGKTGGVALKCNRARIDGSVFLTKGFKASSEVRFLGSIIKGDIDCSEGNFLGTEISLSLQKSQIFGITWLSDGMIASGRVDLSSSILTDLIDDQETYKNLLFDFDGMTYRRFIGEAPTDADARLLWLGRQYQPHPYVDFRPQPWEECARVLAEMGHEQEANLIRIEKRRRMRCLPWRRATHVLRRLATLPSIVFDWVLDKTVGYGWAPRRPLYWLFALWITASVGYATLPPGVMAPADALVYLAPSMPAECRADWIAWQPPARPDDLSRRAAEAPASGLALNDTVGPPYPPAWSEICPRRAPSEYSTFSPVFYALDVLLPIVDLRQENDWSPRVTDAAGEVIGRFWPNAPCNWLRDWGIGYVARLLEWLLILLGWALSGLLLGAVTGVIRRD